MKLPFEWTDAWLLQAIVIADRDNGVSYLDVVSTADGLNHALLSSDEMESGLARLVSASNDRFFATDQARRVYAKADVGRSVFETRDHLENLIGAKPWSPETPIPNPANNRHFAHYSREAHEKANKEWHEEAKKILERKS